MKANIFYRKTENKIKFQTDHSYILRSCVRSGAFLCPHIMMAQHRDLITWRNSSWVSVTKMESYVIRYMYSFMDNYLVPIEIPFWKYFHSGKQTKFLQNLIKISIRFVFRGIIFSQKMATLDTYKYVSPITLSKVSSTPSALSLTHPFMYLLIYYSITLLSR